MKPIILFYLSLFAFLNSNSQDYVSSHELGTTFQILKDSSTGTCFLIKKDQKTYWVTAKHVLGNVHNKQQVQFSVLSNSKWYNLSGTVLIHSIAEIDIAVMEAETPNGDGIPLTTADIVLGDEGFFLGFPFGMSSFAPDSVNRGFPIPLIKKCVFSGNYLEKKVNVLFLDGNNNPGFSGGPVYFRNRRDPNDRTLYLASVISGYRSQGNQMITPLGTFNYSENSGIIISFAAQHITEILTENGR